MMYEFRWNQQWRIMFRFVIYKFTILTAADGLFNMPLGGLLADGSKTEGNSILLRLLLKEQSWEELRGATFARVLISKK